MLIRSQNKEVLVAFEFLPDIEVSGGVISARRDMGWCCLLGEYSTKAKAMKVLDMIQEAYADTELVPMTVPNIGKTFAEAPPSKENELLAETIEKALMNKMVFQMPEDSEVEV
jgi:saccharopine dehydrogenase-like NADP-dependent oxidoreductase